MVSNFYKTTFLIFLPVLFTDKDCRTDIGFQVGDFCISLSYHSCLPDSMHFLKTTSLMLGYFSPGLSLRQSESAIAFDDVQSPTNTAYIPCSITVALGFIQWFNWFTNIRHSLIRGFVYSFIHYYFTFSVASISTLIMSTNNPPTMVQT